MSEQGIGITLLDQTGSKSIRAKISPTVKVKDIIGIVITKMLLPAVSPDGQPMSYSLDHKEGGKRLQETQTLPEAGVKEGDHLIVFPEITAGAQMQEIWAFVGEDGNGEEALLGAEIPEIGWMPFAAATQDGLSPFTPIVKNAVGETGIKARVVRFTVREEVETVF